MAKYTLPFYSNFFQVMEKNEIVEWRANDFIFAIFGKNSKIKNHERQSIYRGLNILVKCDYLKRIRDKNNKSIFRYSETTRLQQHKNIEKIAKVKEVLKEEQNNLISTLEKRSSEKVFINDIINKNPELKDFFLNYDFVISQELRQLEIKASFIKNIFNDIESLS
ncbi:hypothetical protein ACG9YY_11805 [Acinetobacter pittii]|uniref:hypothetical protein n=1 Tax=Acinetobacter pittii TaxID=48296 RepID=UPI003AF7CACD